MNYSNNTILFDNNDLEKYCNAIIKSNLNDINHYKQMDMVLNAEIFTHFYFPFVSTEHVIINLNFKDSDIIEKFPRTKNILIEDCLLKARTLLRNININKILCI
tara:strand:+ start:7998 stop:8309 length:312 start_codon:yes stop_codon:yes gene_type:complete